MTPTLPTTTMPPTTNAPASFWRRPLVLATLGALLLSCGWPPYPAGPLALLLLVAWVPYLVMERQLTRQNASKRQVFGSTYFMLVLWNALTTWWVSNTTVPVSGVAAVVLNALLMCLPLLAFRQTKKRFGRRLGYLSLPVYWIAFEQLHLHWDLTWPWLTLGNGFAAAPQWVQWYEYTGFLGGSAWVWGVSLLVFNELLKRKTGIGWYKRQGIELVETTPPTTLREAATASFKLRPTPWKPLLAILLPIGLSYLIGATYHEKGPTTEVVVVQPNLDPYEEKFPEGSRFVPHNEQITRMLTLSTQHLTPQTRLVIWPETALEQPVWESTLENNPHVQRIRGWLRQHPGVALLTGITTIISYSSKETATVTARYRDDLGYYDIFNSGAYFVDATTPVAIYHKSRLVPGVEKVPPILSSVLANIDLGGVVGSYGTQAYRTVFSPTAAAPTLRPAPLICYESIYGDFVGEYEPNGATLLTLFTNDAWWGDTPGYRQLLRYGSLRCIETRRDLARAANTGYTGFINQLGEIYQLEPAWVPTASRGTVHLNEEMTFYTRFGELIGRGAQILAVLGILAVVFRMFLARFA